jgi:hypothetical protein
VAVKLTAKKPLAFDVERTIVSRASQPTPAPPPSTFRARCEFVPTERGKRSHAVNVVSFGCLLSYFAG